MKHRIPVTEELMDHADELNSYSVIVRYPNEIQIDEHEVRLSIRYADEILT